jgi:uncharacterized protein (DUF1684 family)
MTKSRLIRRSVSTYLALLFTLLALASCSQKRLKSQVDPAAYQKEIAEWHEQRLTELKSESGWLTLIGLFWLKDGENTFGSDQANDIVLPKQKINAHAGMFRLQNGAARFGLLRMASPSMEPVRSLISSQTLTTIRRLLSWARLVFRSSNAVTSSPPRQRFTES